MILPVYTYGTKVLTTKAKPVTKVDEKLIKLIMDMFDTMHGAKGIGLAANQVGVAKRAVVVDISDVDNENSERAEDPERFKPHPPLILINPEIVSSEGKWVMEEGCLSIPEVRDQVERDEKIVVRFKDTSMNDAELEADGLLARVILHEIDHIDGVLFVERLSSEKRKIHKEQLKKIQKGEFEVEYPVVTAGREKVPVFDF